MTSIGGRPKYWALLTSEGIADVQPQVLTADNVQVAVMLGLHGIRAEV
jgi:hypothetical protein